VIGVAVVPRAVHHSQQPRSLGSVDGLQGVFQPHMLIRTGGGVGIAVYDDNRSEPDFVAIVRVAVVVITFCEHRGIAASRGVDGSEVFGLLTLWHEEAMLVRHKMLT